jgi:para-nitrobenzyl esterase
MLVASPLAAGLFSAALMESGGCPSRTLAVREAEGVELSTTAGCESAMYPLSCLRALDAGAVLMARPGIADVAALGGNEYGPTVDGWVQPEPPLARIAAGRHNRVPFVVGANSDETARSAPAVPSAAAYETLVRTTFDPFGISDAVLAAYPVADYPSPRVAWIQLTSDVKFVCTARDVARAAAAGQDEPVWRYHFTHRLDSGAAAAFGAWHGLELLFVFGHLDVAGYVPSAGEIALSSAMMGYWSRLAASGDPNGAGATAWPEYDPSADAHLVLDDPIATGDGVRTAQCDFWGSVLP